MRNPISELKENLIAIFAFVYGKEGITLDISFIYIDSPFTVYVFEDINNSSIIC